MNETSAVKQTLSGSAVHEIWEQTYRNPESERFYERIFDWIAAHGLLDGKKALDIGCGIGQHAIRLARRGCTVVAADFSGDRVEAARANIERQHLTSRISVLTEDLGAGLSFPDASFDIVLCWGVLMHIPRLERAITELIRVVRPGGTIVLCEANLFGIDAMTTYLATWLKKMTGRGGVRRVQTSKLGREYWAQTSSGELLIRHARMRSLIRFIEQQGCAFRYRIAGEFTEKYSLGGPLGKLCHAWNRLWFSCGHVPYLAHGNLLIFERKQGRPLLVIQ